MEIKETLLRMFYSFFVILSGSLIAMSVSIMIFTPDITEHTVRMIDIGALFVLTILVDLAFFVFYSKNDLSKKQMIIRHVMFYVLVLIITVSIAFYMEWIILEKYITIFVHILLVTLVYILVIMIDIYQSKRLADRLNQKLKERYKG